MDAKRISPRTPLKKGHDSDLDNRNLEKEELLEAEKRCTYEIVERSEEDMEAMCDERGEFICKGVWNRDSCQYEDDHKINPYKSKEELVLFSTWNLDHQSVNFYISLCLVILTGSQFISLHFPK